MEPNTAMKLTQPRFGEPQLESSLRGKIHLQTKFNGRTYLSLVCWEKEPFHWSWHFYNRKMDLPFQKQDLHFRAKSLMKLLKEAPDDAQGELLTLLKQWQKDHRKESEIEEVQEESLVAIASPEEPAVVEEDTGPPPPAEDVVFEGHNLIAYYEELNEKYFNNEIDVPISWTKKYLKDYNFGITFGVFIPESREIRINSRLNQDWVPDYSVKCVIHHEMLHVVVPAKRMNRQTWVHHKEFRLRERQFEDFKKAVLWQRQNLRKIMKKPAVDKTSEQN